MAAFSASSILEKVYAKVGPTGVLGVVSLYLVYRYSRGFLDEAFAARLCSENAQAGIYGIDIPYIAITWTTPLIALGLAHWSAKESPAKLPQRTVTAIRIGSSMVPALAGVFVVLANYGTVCDNPVQPASGYFRMGIWTPFGRMDGVVLAYGVLCAVVSGWQIFIALRARAAKSQPTAEVLEVASTSHPEPTANED